MKVSFLDLKLQYNSIKDEMDDTLQQVLDGITTALGQSSYVKIFIPWTWDDGYQMKPHADFKLHNQDH